MGEQILIGIGSNLDGPVQQVNKALHALDSVAQTALLRHSSLYLSKPQGPQDQEDFCNAAALLHTSLAPVDLLLALQSIENDCGRIKTRHWGERVIDLDILFYGQQQISIDEPDLQVPHPFACQRDFVLQPVLEICPDWRLPDGKRLASCLAGVTSHNLRRITAA